MKIISISDLHGYLPEIIEPADILCIGGDISPVRIQFNKLEMKKWLETEFLYWVINSPVDKIILIAGNHDAYFESISKTNILELEILSHGKLKYLKNELYIYTDKTGKEYSIFGTPYCNIFGSWPFMRTDEYMKEKFKKIPDVVDIIISHSPPYGVGEVDTILEYYDMNKPIDHIGNEPLRNRLEQIEYKLLVSGHIHSGSHIPFEFNGGKCVNVSLLDENYQPIYKPFYYEL